MDGKSSTQREIFKLLANSLDSPDSEFEFF